MKETQKPEKAEDELGLSNHVKELLASCLSTLGRFHNGEYVLNQHCLSSLKDIIRSLRNDNERYGVRRFLGRAKVVQNDLIHIIKVCPPESVDLFDLTIRLLTALTNSVVVLYGEEIPAEKIGRRIYMNLIEHLQDYKEAFYDIDFWNVICGKLTDYFEIDWTERSESQSIQIEKMLVLLRNVLHIPADPEREKITENDISIHDKILWSLRQSQILEFLLYVSSNKSESRYYLHLLEIFSLILREQNPKLLALSEVQRSTHEREKDMKDLIALREKEKVHKNMYKHTRTFDSTFVLKGVKSFSGRDMIYHGSLEDMKESVVSKDKKRAKPRNGKVPVQSEQVERRSSFSVRIFLKEFCIEFLNCSYNNLMSIVKEKLVSGKGLPNDEIFYFWALKFFLEFNCTYNLDIKLISDSVNVQTFHYLQTNAEENFERLITERKRRNLWVRKLHFILKAYHSLLQTLKWMDSSKDASVREMSKVLKSQIFYVAEYREMALSFLTRYDSDVFSTPYLRDMIEANHLAMKLLEDYTKNNKIVVRKRIRKKAGKKRRKKGTAATRKARPEPVYESNEAKWERIKDEAYKALSEGAEFPDVAPFDVLLELTDEEQKERTMRNVQRFLHEGRIADGIGLLRSARKAWPENDHFGCEGMSVEDEVMALQEICLAELGNERVPVPVEEEEEEEAATAEDGEEEDGEVDEEDEDVSGEDGDGDVSYRVSEESFDMMSYKKQLVNKRVVEACSVLLQNYEKNSDYTNHCIVKVLFRVGWECSMPAMMYQASLFWTLLAIMNDKHRNYKEINDFTVHLVRKFREHASNNKFIFVDLLFWKDPSVALEIQDQLGPSNVDDAGENKENRKGKKAASWSVEEEDELQRLWNECDPGLPARRKVEWVKSNLIDQSKSLQGVKRKLKELGLVSDNVRAARLNSGKEWLEEEVEELTKYFKEFQGAVDIVSVISDHLTLKRTKKSISQKLLDLGLVKSLSQLRKRKGRGGGRKAHTDESGSESSDDSDDEENRPARVYSFDERREAVRRVQHLKTALEWLRDTIQESIEEDDEETEAYPLLAVEQPQIEALETADFVDLMRKLGLEEPAKGQVYWKIPKRDKSDREQTVKLLTSAIDGVLPVSDGSDSEDEFEKLKRMTRQPLTPQDNANKAPEPKRRPKTARTQALTKLAEKKKTTRRVSRRSLADSDSSDDEPNRVESNDSAKVDTPLSRMSDDEGSRVLRKVRQIGSDSDSDDEPRLRIAERRDMDKEFDKLIGSSGGESSDDGMRRRRTSVEGRTQKESGRVAPEVDSDDSADGPLTSGKGSKRRRCISSDSDREEEGDGGGSVSKRLRVVDSDSDLDSNALAGEGDALK